MLARLTVLAGVTGHRSHADLAVVNGGTDGGNADGGGHSLLPKDFYFRFLF